MTQVFFQNSPGYTGSVKYCYSRSYFCTIPFDPRKEQKIVPCLDIFLCLSSVFQRKSTEHIIFSVLFFYRDKRTATQIYKVSSSVAHTDAWNFTNKQNQSISNTSNKFAKVFESHSISNIRQVPPQQKCSFNSQDQCR